MRIERNQNLSFKGTLIKSNIKGYAENHVLRPLANSATVKFNEQSYAENPLLRPLINYLKHNCGGKGTEHTIEVISNKKNWVDQLTVRSRYTLNKNFDGANTYEQEFRILSENPVTKENVQKMLANLEDTAGWLKALKKIDKAQTAKNTPANKTKVNKIIADFKESAWMKAIETRRETQAAKLAEAKTVIPQSKKSFFQKLFSLFKN